MGDISFTGLFLHDTQMAQLSLAQRRLAAAFTRLAPESTIPFSFMLPFCPVRGAIAACAGKGAAHARTRLTVGPAETDSGWIVAPATESPEQTDGAKGPEAEASILPPTLPGYPELPRRSALILGYAGPLANTVLAEAIAAELQVKDGRDRTVLTEALSVRARYRARVDLTIVSDNRTYSVTYKVGPASWER